VNTVPIRRALISVYDKTGVAALAEGLHRTGVEIVSTGSTAQVIRDAGVPVVEVASVTGFPECLDGRVKTLHPGVHAGLLADVRRPDHRSQLDELGIAAFQLLVVNLYPFVATVASGAGPEDCVEQIDIGGPAMIRAAAKNHAAVAVVVDPARYGEVLAAAAQGGFAEQTRRELAADAYAHTADYDIAVASWMRSVHAATPQSPQFPSWAAASWHKAADLRYGENPHQAAALYRSGGGLAAAEQLQGKEMSYNNYVDADAAWRTAHDFAEPAVAIIKHANPCGVAVGPDIATAYAKAFQTDPISAFGGVVACNGEVNGATARAISEVFTEVVAAPAFTDEAVTVLSVKKNLRLLRVAAEVRPPVEMRPISGGLLLQSRDAIDAAGDDPTAWQLVAGQAADDATMADLAFAWRACRGVKSNAILLARDGAAVGVGMGQVNRVDSARLAVSRAGAERARGAVAASDAFFPFPDGLQVLIDAGVQAVVQPGGSVRDDEVIAAAEAAGITMMLTGTRHFFH
jgi:phosphoribosylaminoimidazolecarboxamide formyltransferase/IMP cyclohydrolase